MSIYTGAIELGIFLLVSISIVVVILTVIIVLKVIDNKKDKKVRCHSTYLKEILFLNAKYNFDKCPSIRDVKVFNLKSKRQFDTFNASKAATTHICNNKYTYLNAVNQMEQIQAMHSVYLVEFKTISNTKDPLIFEITKIPELEFIKRENKIGRSMRKTVSGIIQLRLKWSYCSPKGRNVYYNSHVFDYRYIKSVLETYVKETPRPSPVTKPKTLPKHTVDEEIVTIDDIPDIE